jgi:integrase
LAPKTVRHMGSLLYTVLSDADRLGVLRIPHPMANRRVLLPKLAKPRPPVLDEGKLRTLFERAHDTRLYPFVVLAAATGCRRGELLALQWTDIDLVTGLLTVSKSLEQTKAAGLRVKSTKSEEPRQLGVPEWAIEVLKEAPDGTRPRPGPVRRTIHRQQFDFLPARRELLFARPPGRPSSGTDEESGASRRESSLVATFSRQHPAQQRSPGGRCLPAPRPCRPEHHAFDLQPRRRKNLE